MFYLNIFELQKGNEIRWNCTNRYLFFWRLLRPTLLIRKNKRQEIQHEEGQVGFGDGLHAGRLSHPLRQEQSQALREKEQGVHLRYGEVSVEEEGVDREGIDCKLYEFISLWIFRLDHRTARVRRIAMF